MVSSHSVAGALSTGLQALQHRGQDSCGIITSDGGRFPTHRGVGLVRDVFDRKVVEELTGHGGIGHVRYPTIGRGVLADAQPFFDRRPGVIMAHNGNVTNYERLRAKLADHSIHLLSSCDVEPVLCLFTEALMERRRRNHTIDDVVAALRDTVRVVEGAYTLAILLEIDGVPTLVGFRDPHGIRPGVWGRRGDAWMLASESVSLDALSFEMQGDLPPGRAVFLRAGEEPIIREVDVRTPAPCIFESIYFSRPDSVVGEATVYEARLAMGRRLAAEWAQKGFEVDRVIAVPDTSRPAAIAFAEELGVPCREGFIKNRYSGRTFIMGSQGAREAALRLKLNLIRSEFEGKRVVIIDDSIVRGSTIRRLLDIVRSQGPLSVHFAIHAPPVLNPCFYGIDMSTREELAAVRYLDPGRDDGAPLSIEEQRRMERRWAEDLGIDSLTFLSVKGLDEVRPGKRCAACFDGVYPLQIPREQRAAIVKDRTLEVAPVQGPI
jgi:amidophosphoribosyltransferase